jgi:imidazoleglycerol-phosphate dehydratase/histidinol-phosphatase
MVGKMPTEMFCISLNRSQMVQKQTSTSKPKDNEHHKIEAIFKAFAKAIVAVKRDTEKMILPSTGIVKLV